LKACAHYREKKNGFSPYLVRVIDFGSGHFQKHFNMAFGGFFGAVDA
jgi:hypothetical protein